MRVVWGYDDETANWVARRIPRCERGFGNCRAAAVLDNDKIVAGVVLHNWNPEAGVIEMSIASTTPRWFTRDVAEEILGYAFNKCKCQMVTARTAEANKRARKLWSAMGSSEYIIPNLRGRGESEVIMTMTDDDWSESRIRR